MSPEKEPKRQEKGSSKGGQFAPDSNPKGKTAPSAQADTTLPVKDIEPEIIISDPYLDTYQKFISSIAEKFTNIVDGVLGVNIDINDNWTKVAGGEYLSRDDILEALALTEQDLSLILTTALEQGEEPVETFNPYGKHEETLNRLLSQIESITPSTCLAILAGYPDFEYFNRYEAERKVNQITRETSTSIQNLLQEISISSEKANIANGDNNISTVLKEKAKYVALAILAGDKITEYERHLLVNGWENACGSFSR